jgi:hypothetical protein
MRLNPSYTSLKTLTITYRTPQETLLSTPQSLPTTEPSTPQISYTVASTDLPTLSLKVTKTWTALLYGAGRNTGSTSQTLYWRMKKNGTNVATNSSTITQNYYYTVNAYFYDISVGDVLELSLWASSSNLNWDYKAFQVQVTRINLFNNLLLLKPCNFKAISAQPVLTSGNPVAASTTNIRVHHLDANLDNISAAKSYTALMPGPLYKTYRLNTGDFTSNIASVNSHSSNRPYYNQQYVPTTIEARGFLIG